MKTYLKEIFNSAENKLDYLQNIELQLSKPQDDTHGDYATNIAMTLTKKLKRNPREIAQEIIDSLEFDKLIISKVEIAGPGFVNFFFTPSFVNQIVDVINKKQNQFGLSKEFNGKRANVEFVSANPTGPLTVGHGRNAVIGDTVATLLETVGYNVDREYYFNNAGRQMRVLGHSVAARYLELLGEEKEFDEEFYQGEYIKDIAKVIYDKHGDKFKNNIDDEIFKATAEEEIFNDIKNSLLKIDIKFEIFFNENDLYTKGDIQDIIETFENKNLTYKKDGAVWLKFSELGQEVDKVIVKSTGEPTYRLPDIAYHKNKFERNYDFMIDVFGSDHGATYPDVLAGIESLGFDKEKVKVIIYQFVTILSKGKAVKMSTRKANYITLDELIDDVGKDVVRYFFIRRNSNSHMNFDLDVAKKQSDENPVFYLKYAHARIASIFRTVKDEKLEASFDNLILLDTNIEQKLVKQLHKYQEEVMLSAIHFEPHKLAAYLENLAALFHKFYAECRILGSDKKLAEARIALILAVKIVLKNGLKIFSLEAPEKM
ncbi:MAG: arginine--tRNA ligase [Ignavibacteriae bacterium]|nr:arginine--tRNA ligase [Ignavibacteriota bacterium]